ncbi:hypothetical protein B7P34_01550 [Streptosporangium nondiastaticum]|uniref:Uncharacterized protein n=1 Tax=Streptosporangium nondiastaticum TaxID=35764 RepID=A0A9X7JVL2_9ACTN|nr:hypothetical protein B7P34_01550 [Streptosporangium nondiastaticum]
MGSLSEELERREAEVRARLEELRGQIDGLTRRLAAEEEQLTRLRFTRETVDELFAETVPDTAPEARDDGGIAGGRRLAFSRPRRMR